MDVPIRVYAHHEIDVEPVAVKRVKPKRPKPFEAEYALLRELGLR